MKQKTLFTILILSVLPLISIGVTLQSLNKPQSTKSHAQVPVTLISPYIRLVTDKNDFRVGDEVPVHVYVDTNSEQTLENRFVIAYDNSVLSIKPTDIQNKNVYPVVDIESISGGKVIFSVFVKNEAGYTPITLYGEEEVATLNFHVISNTQMSTQINVNKDSSITTARVSPEQNPDNILYSVSGVDIGIN